MKSPLTELIEARQHSPAYLMHRYFAMILFMSWLNMPNPGLKSKSLRSWDLNVQEVL